MKYELRDKEFNDNDIADVIRLLSKKIDAPALCRKISKDQFNLIAFEAAFIIQRRGFESYEQYVNSWRMNIID